MTEDQHIRDLLQQKLSGAEAPVDPNIWSQLQQQLPTPGGAASGSAGGGAAGASGGFSAVAGVIATVVVGGAIALGVYFSGDDTVASAPAQEEVVVANAETNTATEQPSEDTQRDVSEETTTVDDRSDEKPSRELKMITNTDDPVADTITVETIYSSEQETEEASETPVVADEQGAAEASDNSDASAESETTEEQAQPDANLSAEFTVSIYDRETLTRHFEPAFRNGVQYIWFFGDGEMSTERSPQHTYEFEDDYTVILQVVDAAGFDRTEEQQITVDLPAKLVLANVFTPNNDGVNDILGIHPESRKVTVQQMVVYDSNGKVVFEESGNGSGWDGNDQAGNQCPEGAYILTVVAYSDAGKVFNERRIVKLLR
ncbi:gliding motility-associated C-terminal domain-containing protein [Sanyastnella coralliicola]|uniref:T9SS type B sorting domain-containing protein n=1 Tax=Sanyastnella coralliicola TaxID=3069118 RepID=UPI0027B9B76D|nr:gliding motility-associated C-terminal domain-containing protein [Longitalea sp. SCSIO 12813]